MKITGIVAEYNPFHNGHEYQLNEAKSHSDAIVAVMSGNFVERSESAVVSKKYRAEMALSCGADLVIELPLAYATASAEKFAFGAVFLLNALGAVNSLSFGSECNSIEKLEALANAIVSPKVDEIIKTELENGISYPAARENAVAFTLGSDYAAILSEPNDILAVEYIKAINSLSCDIKPETVLRKGALHDSPLLGGNIVSASALRKIILSGGDFCEFVPPEVSQIIERARLEKAFPSDFSKLGTAALALLRKSTAADFSEIPDVSEGIENRIIASARNAKTLEEVFDEAKTKRYTHSRIRRIVLRLILGVTNDFYNEMPQYIRVLGLNETGRSILRSAKQNASLPVVMNTADIKKLGPKAQKQFELECRATDLFNLTLPEIAPCGTEMTDNVVVFE